jgi:predicted RNA methylase
MNIIKYYFPIMQSEIKTNEQCSINSVDKITHSLGNSCEQEISRDTCSGIILECSEHEVHITDIFNDGQLDTTGKYVSKIRNRTHLFNKNISYKFLMRNMRYDSASIMYMSRRIDAETITGIIISHIYKLGYNYENLMITDATAGIGGNTFSFATFFKHVNSVEINERTFDMLTNNVTKYKYDNVNMINSDYVRIMYELRQDIVFIDPPWGGKNYKSFDSILLKLSDVNIEEICHNLLLRDNIVVLKLPLNYNFAKLYKKMCCENVKVFAHKLKKMFIVVIYTQKF